MLSLPTSTRHIGVEAMQKIALRADMGREQERAARVEIVLL